MWRAAYRPGCRRSSRACPSTSLWYGPSARRKKHAGTLPISPPGNVVKVVDVYLDSVIHETLRKNPRRYRLTKPQYEAIREMLSSQNPDWNEIFALFQNDRHKGLEFLLNPRFFLPSCRRSARSAIPLWASPICSGPCAPCFCHCYTCWAARRPRPTCTTRYRRGTQACWAAWRRSITASPMC